MRQNHGVQTLTSCVLSVGLAFAGMWVVAVSAAAQDSVVIEPTENGDIEEIDPKSVAVTSDGTQLSLVFDAGQDVVAYLRSHPAGSIAEVWMDTDLDTTTGGQLFFSDVGGFDYAAQRVYVCKAFQGGHVCAGDTSDVEFTEFFSDYSPQAWDPAAGDFADIHESRWEGGREALEGNHVTVHIPYAAFAGKSGQTVRLVVLSGTYGGSKFPEVQLRLKSSGGSLTAPRTDRAALRLQSEAHTLKRLELPAPAQTTRGGRHTSVGCHEGDVS